MVQQTLKNSDKARYTLLSGTCGKWLVCALKGIVFEGQVSFRDFPHTVGISGAEPYSRMKIPNAFYHKYRKQYRYTKIMLIYLFLLKCGKTFTDPQQVTVCGQYVDSLF